MYNIYKTNAFVLAADNFGEANRFVYLLTDELGFLRAAVQGVRELKSKLKNALQPFSYSEVSLVRGKDVWRVTGARRQDNFDVVFKNPDKITSAARIFSVVKRMSGELGHDEGLFNVVYDGISFLAKDVDEKDLSTFDIVFAAKVLEKLGYWSEPTLMTEKSWEEGMAAVGLQKANFILLINRSLQSSHL
ncbi:MAG: DNA repair protein RecO [Candidatus Paceibacterota bacterium]|jgi:DNA repair protein RecO (recombination protein O)